MSAFEAKADISQRLPNKRNLRVYALLGAKLRGLVTGGQKPFLFTPRLPHPEIGSGCGL